MGLDQWEKDAALDLRVVSSSPTLSANDTLKNKKHLKKNLYVAEGRELILPTKKKTYLCNVISS